MMLRGKRPGCVLKPKYEGVFANKESESNFLKFALTSCGMCMGHSLSESYTKELLGDLSQGKRIYDDVKKEFFNAVVNLKRLSRSKGSNVITIETTDEYFLSALHNNFAPCQANIGKVESSDGKSALVKIGEGVAEYNSMLAPFVKPGNKVIVHGRYVVKCIER